MKVICIDDKPRIGDVYMGFDLKEGEIYTVIDEFVSPDYNVDCYSLLEDPNNEEWGFEQSRFIPLSEIDEMEESKLVNEPIVLV